jgi:hypothetical protein
MPPKKQPDRVSILWRISPELKSRIDQATVEDDVTINDWLIDVVEAALAKRDTKGVAEKRKAELERQLDVKFEAIVSYLAAKAGVGDRTTLSADKRIALDEKADSALDKWRDHAASNYGAEPRTPLESLCKDYSGVEDEIEGGAQPDGLSEIDTLLLLDPDLDVEEE